MRRRGEAATPQSALRLFVAFAVVSPVPVLGLVLAASYRSNAAARGLAEARAQAGLFARTSVEPRLAGADLTRTLDAAEVADLDSMSRSAVADGDIVRFRIRSLDGRVCEVPAHAAIVQSVTDLAHRLGFHVVAEGVEHQPILDALAAAGCDVAQGYHIARPMPAAALGEWLAARRTTYAAPVPVAPERTGRHRSDAVEV